jgi:deoxyribodipyrimidine photolyase-like uncharacterized protein
MTKPLVSDRFVRDRLGMHDFQNGTSSFLYNDDRKHKGRISDHQKPKGGVWSKDARGAAVFSSILPGL